MILYSELARLNHDVTCFKLQRYGEIIGDKKLSAEHTPNQNTKTATRFGL